MIKGAMDVRNQNPIFHLIQCLFLVFKLEGGGPSIDSFVR